MAFGVTEKGGIRVEEIGDVGKFSSVPRSAHGTELNLPMAACSGVVFRELLAVIAYSAQ